MRTRRSLTVLAGLATALFLGACGGGGDSTPPPPATAAPTPAPVQLDTARIASATVDSTGGTVTATGADGKRYVLTVPPGALATATEITATPVLTMGDAPLAAGLKAAVRFGPSGLRFALPATLRIEGASPTVAAGTSLVGFLRSQDGVSMQLMPVLVRGGDIELEVRHFSDAGVAQATAQAVAAVPVATNADAVDALVDEHLRASTPEATADDLAASLIRLHDTRVAGRLAAAELGAASTPDDRDTAMRVAEAWVAMVRITFEGAFDATPLESAVPANLAAVVGSVRQRVTGILGEQFERGLQACQAPAPIGTTQLNGLELALEASARAVQRFASNGGLPGLDVATLARRLNDCVRVAFEPTALPTFEVGRPVSLDARAQLIFAADPNASIQVPFEFVVESDDAAIDNPRGFSDAQGRYTTVVNARTVPPLFDVRACMGTSVTTGGAFASVLCGSQTLGGTPTSVVLSGRATLTVDVVNGATGSSVTERGTVDLRVRADADGSLTVLEAIGSVSSTLTGSVTCRPDPVADPTLLRTVTLTTRHQHAIVTGSFVPDSVRPGFRFTGPTTSTIETIADRNNNCDVSTLSRTIDDGDDFGLARIVATERGADGLPVSLTLGDFTGAADGTIQGRLVRN